MLHIILGMLKFTGIVIGLLLCFLLCIVSALLFVPVRYRVGAVKQGEKLQLNIGLSWMLRMVSVAASQGRQEERVVLVRLFGFRLPVFGGKKPEKNSRKKRRQKKSGTSEHGQQKKKKPEEEFSPATDEDVSLTVVGGRSLRLSETEDKPDMKESFEECPEESDLSKEPESSETPKKDREDEPDMRESSEEYSEAPKKDSVKKEQRPPREKQKKKFSSWLHRCSAAIRRAQGKAAALKKKLKELWKGFLSLLKKPAQLKRALERAQEKLSAFFYGIEEYEIKEILGSLYGEAFYLLSHYKPRRIRGYLRFGAGDPALTGCLTGLIYLLLPARADQFDVMPDFYETTFETEVIFTGYVRSVHLVRTILHVVCDKKVHKAFCDYRSHPNVI